MGEGVVGVLRPMTTYVADTHALYWCLTKSPRLGAQAREAFMAGDQGNAAIFVPAIVLAGLFYLNRKLKNVLDFVKVVEELLRAGQFVLLPLIAEDTLDFDLDQAVPE